MIGIIISVDTNENARLKYFILMRGLNRILWFMESEIIGYV